MTWFEGPPLLPFGERLVGSDANHVDARSKSNGSLSSFRQHHDFRGFAGRVAGGVFKVGDESCPSFGFSTKIQKILSGGEEKRMPFPQSVTILLEDEIGVSRGDMLVNRTISLASPKIWMPGFLGFQERKTHKGGKFILAYDEEAQRSFPRSATRSASIHFAKSRASTVLT